MFANLGPLLPYMRRYWKGYVWGCLCTVLANAIWVQFPRVIGLAVHDLNAGVTWGKIFSYAGLLLGVTVAHGILLFLMRWIIIGEAVEKSTTQVPGERCSRTPSGPR